ncbi:MAG: exodeoxyribonuclease V subunit alpha [Acidimicrobiia bacterium]
MTAAWTDRGEGRLPVARDPFDSQRARRAAGRLGSFNDAGVISSADVHVAVRLCRLGAVDPEAKSPEADDIVALAAALAVRATRLGHVCTDLRSVGDTVTVDAERAVDLGALSWPDPREWLECLSESPLVAVGAGGHAERPLRLVGTRLYLDRYWREERQVATDLQQRNAPVQGVDLGALAGGLDRLFGEPDGSPDHQRLAAACAVLRQLAVVAGGPGTGKTTTAARILALIDEQASATGSPPPLVALTAPTGKAAARLEQAVHEEAAHLDVAEAVRVRLGGARASTLHRLLGWRPGSHSRFRHHRGNRLPHDLVVVDETSMVSLSLMSRLVEAVRPEARLVLIGDPQQLASVEAGAVLGDLVGPVAGGLVMAATARAVLADVAGQAVQASTPAAVTPPLGRPTTTSIGDGIVVLRRVHRFGGGIAEIAEAVRGGDDESVVKVLTEGRDDVRWISVDVADPGSGRAMEPVQRAVLGAARRVTVAARGGHAGEAIAALGAFRLLCAHRHGPYGVASWTSRIEGWLAADLLRLVGDAPGPTGAPGPWYAGRPLLVTENDYGLRLYNGDTGVVVAGPDGRLVAVFERGRERLELSPTRLGSIDTVHAMTVHKSQGSQFDQVAVLLPDPVSRILTRELLYTAVTRARSSLILAGTEASVRAAVTRPVARASGLSNLLWGEGTR